MHLGRAALGAPDFPSAVPIPSPVPLSLSSVFLHTHTLVYNASILIQNVNGSIPSCFRRSGRLFTRLARANPPIHPLLRKRWSGTTTARFRSAISPVGSRRHPVHPMHGTWGHHRVQFLSSKMDTLRKHSRRSPCPPLPIRRHDWVLAASRMLRHRTHGKVPRRARLGVLP